MPWFEPARNTIRCSPSGGDGSAGAGRGVVRDLIAELSSALPERRRRAISKVQEHSRTDLAPGLLVLLKSVSPGVRRDATEALGFVGFEMVEEAGKGLLGLLYDPDANVREEAAIALWRLVYLPAVPELQKAMCFDAEASVRRSIARMLGSFGTNSDHQSFYEYALRDEDAVVRANAAVGLGLGGQPAFRDRILRLLQSEQDPMALAGYFCGIWLLGGGPQPLEDFVRLGQDPEIFAETCQWVHRYLDGKPAGADTLRDLSRIRAALRVYPEADEVVRRIAIWQGELTVAKAPAAVDGAEEAPAAEG
jgi:hypothetical protein